MKTIKWGLKYKRYATPRRVKLLGNLIVHTLAGAGMLSWAQARPDIGIIFTIIAGAIDKYIIPYFGETDDFKEQGEI